MILYFDAEQQVNGLNECITNLRRIINESLKLIEHPEFSENHQKKLEISNIISDCNYRIARSLKIIEQIESNR